MTLTKTGALALMMTCTALTAAPAWADFTDGVIRIGVMNDQSGPYADNCGAGSVTMARLAIEDHGGAINGVPVELVIADDQNQPDIGVATARRWVEEEGVDAIVGCSASSIALAVQDVMRQHERPYLIAGTATTETTNSQCSPMTTNWAYDTYTLARGSVNAQIEQGNLRWYFITVDYTFGHAWQADATRFVEAAGGEVLGSTLHPWAPPTSPRNCCRRRPAARRSSASPTRAPTLPTSSSRPRNSASSPPVSTSRRWAS